MSSEEKYTSIHSTNRIEAFSDGVIAIIVTLLIFQIIIAQLRHGQTFNES